jgi:hypothetical protein
MYVDLSVIQITTNSTVLFCHFMFQRVHFNQYHLTAFPYMWEVYDNSSYLIL